MILLPGFDGTGELFGPLTDALSPDHRPAVIRYSDERTFDEYVDTASAALPDRDAILIAESFSGPIALGLLARHPEKIRCAVLCATFLESPFRALARLARFLPPPLFDATVKDVAGPHLLLQSRPRECARLIEEFVSTKPALTELTG